MSSINNLLKNLYYIFPIEILLTIFHLIFRGPFQSDWSFEFTLIVKFITYGFNLIPLLGFNLFRAAFDFNYFYKFWELRSSKLELPSKSVDDSSAENLELHFMWYQPNGIGGMVANWFENDQLTIEDMKSIINSTSSRSIVMYIHGGGFVFGSSNSHKSIILDLCKSTGLPVISVDYRLCPEYKFPAPLIDLLMGYNFILDKKLGLGLSSDKIFISGDSAGGNLSLSLAYYLRDYSLPQPKGLMLMSPWLDLTQSNSTWKLHSKFDYLQNHTDRSKSIAQHYLPTQDLICNPYVSPCFGKVEDLPPILIQYGRLEVLYGEITEFSRKFKGKNTKLVLECYSGMVHVFQFFNWTSQAKKAFKNISKFVREIDELK